MFDFHRKAAHGGRGAEESSRFGHRHSHWRGFRSSRFFDHGDLRFLVLKLIADKPRHGYELIKAIEEQFGGAYSPSPGVIYPTLTMLEDLGYATVEIADGGKKKYTITPEGQAFLDANKAQVDAVFARMSDAGKTYGRGLSPDVARAIGGLRSALMTRLKRGNLDEAQARNLAAVLRRAAEEVEKS
jgi:DNA-binding PadR family transcriptional regulator